ncbi:hypothetical protein PCK1_000576 [Pneumocystis canis]|nr:hypothetical protein PCK1_000576 [Pneumocystis canis]
MSKGIYGNSIETSFRKTWDLAEYAQKAADREEEEKKKAKINWEKKTGKATNQTLKQERATLEDVRKRLTWLREKMVDEKKHIEFSLNQRISERQAIEEKERKDRKERKKNRKKEKEKETIVKNEDLVQLKDNEIIQMMGFGNFGSTKV